MPRTWLAEKALITTPITRPRTSNGKRSAMIAKLIEPMTPPKRPVTMRAISKNGYDGAMPQRNVPSTKPE